MRTDIEDMERHIIDLTEDLETEKDRANYFQMCYEEERDICLETKAALEEARRDAENTRDRISRAIDAIPLTDKTREGLSILRVARVRNGDNRLRVSAAELRALATV